MGRKMQERQGPGHQGLAKTSAKTGEEQEARQVLRGFISGGAWGLIASALGLTTASLLAPQPAGNAPPLEPLVVMSQAEAGDVTGDSVADNPLGGNAEVAADPAAPRVGTVPQAPAPGAEPDTLLADTTPANPPVIANAEAGLTAPADGAAPQLAVTADTPVLPNPQAAAPVTPATETDLVLSTEPAAPPVQDEPAPDAPIAVLPVTPDPQVDPAVVPEDVPVVVPENVAQPAAAPIAEPEIAPQPAPEAAPAILADAGPAPAAPDAPTAPAVPEPVADGDTVAAPQAEPVAPAPDLAPEIQPDVLPAAEPAPPPTPEPEVITLTPDPAQTVLPPARIVLQSDAVNLPQVAGGVRVNRPETTPEIAADVPATAEPAPSGDLAVEDVGLALVQFAAPFDNPEGKPLLAVVLLDDGGIAGMAAVLAGVPFAVTVAINPADPDAAARMQTYRDMGIEVLAVAALPEGAQPSDVEVTLESVFATLPQVVGLLDTGNGGVQSSGAVTAQTLARLGADGRGLVVMSAGLNPALRAAATAQVPAAEVYRDLDGDGQDAGTIRRFLDNAAFQARQQSGIVLLARLRPETVSALILWGTENRAAQVALAPISAVLTQ